jgi:hypothetical protein
MAAWRSIKPLVLTILTRTLLALSQTARVRMTAFTPTELAAAHVMAVEQVSMLLV